MRCRVMYRRSAHAARFPIVSRMRGALLCMGSDEWDRKQWGVIRGSDRMQPRSPLHMRIIYIVLRGAKLRKNVCTSTVRQCLGAVREFRSYDYIRILCSLNWLIRAPSAPIVTQGVHGTHGAHGTHGTNGSGTHGAQCTRALGHAPNSLMAHGTHGLHPITWR